MQDGLKKFLPLLNNSYKDLFTLKISPHFQKVATTILRLICGQLTSYFKKIEISALLLHSSGYLAYHIIYVVWDAKSTSNRTKIIA
jgi:hypothetical protein